MDRSEAERLQWVALTILGLVAGLALALPLGVPIFAVLGAMVGTPIVLSIVGLSLGTAQWPVIRRHMSASWWWVIASALGMALGLTFGVTLVEQVGRAMPREPSVLEPSESWLARRSDLPSGWYCGATPCVAGVGYQSMLGVSERASRVALFWQIYLS